VFVPEIFNFLAETKPGKNNEIQLTDAMARMLATRAMYGFRFSGKRYDIGNKLDFLKTNIEFALRRDDVGPGLRKFLKEIAADL
jgi:UTP--glucose-1-phosphate uridylyltransferase